MVRLPNNLVQKLQQREQNNALRILPSPPQNIDFSSNDYLGLAQNELLFHEVHQVLLTQQKKYNGATGSRLLTGNHALYTETETFLAQFHQAEAALIFNSGYDANIGFFSSVLQRNDVVLYDEFCHASIRDGIQMSRAKSYKFKHNDLKDLEKLLQKESASPGSTVYVVTETVFSMDGDTPNLTEMSRLIQKHKAFFVVDEAHALGVFGQNGEGLIQHLNLQDLVFARIVTFGKALGCHGAAILGSQALQSYLVNFARSFIYTTGLAPHAVASILIGYKFMQNAQNERDQLFKNILCFKENFPKSLQRIDSNSSIQSIVFPGNSNVKAASRRLSENGFDVKPILYPTVPEGQERLRFCLHSFNTENQIKEALVLLSR
ncbi:aminotransferase class I/II-fold pyridoxal phosphate-dependent enzyme [Flavobacterium sp.]|uniref:aminotransferase class I/II-fold pyridoxal phosphate-dependent enzyme n=1 Tax=Flavobacterium sp. TaxID=239 RepID=UPI002FDA347B